MRIASGLERVARAAAARPLATLLAVVALALGGGALALGLEPSTDVDTLASPRSEAGAATADHHERFGGDAVLVLIRQRVRDLVLTDDLGRAIQLEGCLGGNVPAGARPYGGPSSPCARIAALKPARVVYGPGTFLNEAARTLQAAVVERLQGAQRAVERARARAAARARRRGATAAQQRRAGEAAAARAQERLLAELRQLAVETGLQGIPQIDDPGFVSQVVFDPARGADVPKARFAFLFPSRDAALIQVRLRHDLTSAERREAIALIRAATRMPMFRLRHGGSYVVSGVPVVVDDLADAVGREITLLLAVAVAVMALVLALAFRARRRLLPLLLALAAAGLTFGAMALAGAGMTMASIAVVPVLIGLAVDYAIQFHARVEEQRAAGAPAPEAVARAARAGGPTIATAALATATGFLVLLLSPVPMVRGFGVLLVVGIALALAVTVTAGSAALALGAGSGDAAGGRRRRGAPRWAPPRWAAPLTASVAGARELLGAGARRTLAAAVRRPGRVLAVAAVIAVAGWASELRTEVVSDVTRLVPAQLPALRDLTTVQEETRSSGEIDVVVSGERVATPAVLRWMADYQRRVLDRFGYDARTGCAEAALCPALSLPDLFASADASSQAAIDALLDALPPYFSSAVLSDDRTAATLAFGIRLMPLDEQQRVIDGLRDELDPPPGASARLAGLPVITAQANAELSSPARRLLHVAAGLLAVGLVLLAVLRDPRRALVPLVPIALATGWSALLLWATGVPLNPMSATLSALVIAISTEFSVLLAERFRQELARARDVAAALRRAYRSTGRAVVASGATAIAGFAVLAFADIRMLRDFGLVTVLDLTVSLLGVLVVLPAVLVLAQRGAFADAGRRLARVLPGRRRRLSAREGAPAP